MCEDVELQTRKDQHRDIREREELTMRVTASAEVSDLTTVGACNTFAGHEAGRNLRGKNEA
jgi:hypothetical protein